MNDNIFSSISSQKDKLINGTTIEEKVKQIEENFAFGNNVYELFDKLCELFNTLNLLETDKIDESKFRFIHAYPDNILNPTSNVVTYNIVGRKPLQVNSRVIPGSSAKITRPVHVNESYNTITGNVEETYKLMFENVISLTVFTTKARMVNNLARLLEGLLLKYSSYIKKYVDNIIYLGTSDIRFLDRGEEMHPFYSRELQFKVNTTEVFKLDLEQIKSIEIQTK